MTNSTGSCVDLSTDLANQLVVWENQIAGVFQARGWEPLQRFAHVTESQCLDSSGRTIKLLCKLGEVAFVQGCQLASCWSPEIPADQQHDDKWG